MAFYLRNSAARRTFKKKLGNANHLIVTAMVGLDAIERGIVTEAPDGFPARWNPRSQSTSARRSRSLILEMALVHSVDALDTYFGLTNRKPFLIQDPEFKAEIDGVGRSVGGKFEIFERYARPSDNVLSALVATSIGWRNKAAHSQDKDQLRKQVVVVLERNAEGIQDRFRGLEVDKLLDGYRQGRIPRMKEVTSFINAMHQYVRAVDGNLLQALAPQRFLRELVWTGVRDADEKGRLSKGRTMQLIDSKWNTSLNRRKQAVEGFLRHIGLSPDKPEEGEEHVVFDDSLVDSLLSMTPTEVYQWVAPSEATQV